MEPPKASFILHRGKLYPSTPIHNEILDKITGEWQIGHSRVYMFLLFNTIGRNVPSLQISVSEIAKRVNLGDQTVRQALHQLCAAGYVQRVKPSNHISHTYSVAQEPQPIRVEKTLSKTIEMREMLAQKSGWVCLYCTQAGTPECGPGNSPWNIDHKVPRSRNGRNNIQNLALSCQACNVAKGTKTAEEFTGGRVCNQ